ncbi:MAG: DMT family transporter, partial [Candidatus Hydrogenedentes bacterium]|nr:DMT family transporter [Candidatus Hydrogenedentota bacterium]
MQSPPRHIRWSTRAALALALACVGWSLAPIFIRLCSADFEPFTQSFARYLSGSAMLGAICLVRWRAEFLELLRTPRRLAGISALNVFMQYIWTVGCYGTPATTAQLIIKVNIVFVIVLAYLLFREERGVIRDPHFLGGTIISLAGLVFVLMKDPRALVPVFDRSTLLLVTMSVCWAVYVVWGKHLAWQMHPVPMFGVMSIHTAIGLGVLSALFGNPAGALSAPARIWMIALVSGFISIGLAHPSFQYAQRELGSA